MTQPTLIKAIITQMPDGTLEIEAPFNKRFVSAFKGGVHSELRTWLPDRECTDPEHNTGRQQCKGRWVVNTIAKLEAITIVKNFFPVVEEQTLGSGVIVHKWEGI